VSWAKLIDRYWSQHEKPSGRASPPYRATQRRNSRSGRKPNNWEKTVRPWFTHYCRPDPDWTVLRLAGFQIAATKTPTQLSARIVLASRHVIIRRTVVLRTNGRHSWNLRFVRAGWLARTRDRSYLEPAEHSVRLRSGKSDLSILWLAVCRTERGSGMDRLCPTRQQRLRH